MSGSYLYNSIEKKYDYLNDIYNTLIVRDIFERNNETIRSEVLAVSIAPDSLSGYSKEWNINGEKVTLSVEKQ